MRTRCRRPARPLLPLLLSFCCITCGRPSANDQASLNSARPVPFRDASDSSALGSASTSSLAVPDDGSGPPRDLPFHPRNLPAGTLLSVRLNDAISADGRAPGAPFSATLDEPIVIEGKTVLPLGTVVSGLVESAGESGASNERGSVRLTLNSIQIGGRDISVSTSTLFARGTVSRRPGHARSRSVQLELGRRLTFRLTEPLSWSGQIAISSR